MADATPIIRNVLIPLDRYPHINENQTLHDALNELKSFTAGTKNRLRYDTLLVVNDQNQLVGKVTLIDMLRALFPPLYDALKVNNFQGKRSEFPNLAILLEDKVLKGCSLKTTEPINNIMSDAESFIKADTQILKTLTIMLDTGNYNLPVIDGNAIIGVIRLEEIFLAMCNHCNI